MSKEYLEAFKAIYNNIDYLTSDVVIEDDEVNSCLMAIKEQLPIIESALQRLEAIDNAEPNEALECVDDLIFNFSVDEYVERYDNNLKTIKQALLKQQESKHYLKWEDLEFDKTTHKLKAKMNDSLYRIEWFIDGMGFKTVNIYLYVTKDYLEFCTYLQDEKKQFFNDLHLERVE